MQAICLAEDSMSNMMVANQMLNKLPMEYSKDQSWDHFSLLYTLIIFQEHTTAFFPLIFADDTSVFREGTHLEQMIHIINEELQKIDTWLKANKFTINLLKTHYTIFHRARKKLQKTGKYNRPC